MTPTLLERRCAAVMDNYGTPPLALVRGFGTRVWDEDGREYLDLVAGIAVSALGHCHPRVIEAVTRQMSTLGHVSNLYANEPQIQLAERLIELLGNDGRVFFCNSGSEANETAIKMARRTGRPGLVATEGAFHGRTTGALSITGQAAKRVPFEPLLPGVTFVPYGDVDALRAAVGPDTGALFLEPTLGEAGIVPPPAGYLAAARAVCDEAGALLVLDEVQSGLGRTGAWFAHQTAGVRPDVVTLAKGLGGGLPIGAAIGLGGAGALLRPGDHGSTFGGGPVVCAAALTVLDVIAEDGLLEAAKTTGERLADGILGAGDPLVAGVRGSGLWRAVVLAEPVAPAFEAAARRAGFLVNAVSPTVLRLAPPLILSGDDADSFSAAVPSIAAATRAAAEGAVATPAAGAEAASDAASQAAGVAGEPSNDASKVRP